MSRVSGGALGKVTVARTYRLSNMYPNGIGKAAPGDPPAGLNWDMWLGPRPARPFQATIAPYKFRWWDAYSSQIANWGVHYLDAIRWVLGEEAPASISAHGGRFAIDDDRTIPDTLEAVFEFASGRLALFGQYEASGNPALRSGEIEFRGTLGTAYSAERNFEFIAERGGQFQKEMPRTTPVRVNGQRRRPHVATRAELPRLHRFAEPAECGRGDRPSLDVVRPPGQSRPRYPRSARLGREERTRHQSPGRQRSARLRISRTLAIAAAGLSAAGFKLNPRPEVGDAGAVVLFP